MVDRTPINNLSIKMRARRFEQLLKSDAAPKSTQRYTALKIDEQKEEARGQMKKRDKHYEANEAREIRPYTANCKFIFEFDNGDAFMLKCSKISNLEAIQEIEEYAEGGNPQPHFFTSGKRKSDTLRIERAVVSDEYINKLKPGIRIRGGWVWIYHGDSIQDNEFALMGFEEGIITKCQYSDLDAMGANIFIQTLEITHTGLTTQVV